VAAAANGDPDDNTTALAIANLNDAPQAASMASLSDAYDTTDTERRLGRLQCLSGRHRRHRRAANTDVAAAVDQRRFHRPGSDEHDHSAANLRGSAAELISTVNQMLQTLLSIT
jgi:hypothetical protein